MHSYLNYIDCFFSPQDRTMVGSKCGNWKKANPPLTMIWFAKRMPTSESLACVHIPRGTIKRTVENKNLAKPKRKIWWWRRKKWRKRMKRTKTLKDWIKTLVIPQTNLLRKWSFREFVLDAVFSEIPNGLISLCLSWTECFALYRWPCYVLSYFLGFVC